MLRLSFQLPAMGFIFDAPAMSTPCAALRGVSGESLGADPGGAAAERVPLRSKNPVQLEVWEEKNWPS